MTHGVEKLSFRERVRREDASAVRRLVDAAAIFSEAEVAIAVHLVEAALADSGSGYRFLLAEREGGLAGFTCFGAVPATQGSFDLYWIVVDPACHRQGVGRALLARTEALAASLGARRLWVDTSGRADYATTRAFYERMGFHRAAVLHDFYAPGDDKLIFVKTLPAGA